MKLIYHQLCNKHPHIATGSIDMFESVLNMINKLPVQELNYDFGVTDNILVKIKEKVGESNTKVRKRAVELYAFMMKKNFCDYNNLINELIEDEVVSEKEFYSSKTELTLVGKPVKSSKIVVGKLEIFENILKDFDQAIRDKRTEMTTFPFNSFFKYMCLNLTHPKSEVRKMSRKIVNQAKNKFGFKKLEPYLIKVDVKELEKILDLIPDLKGFVDAENERLKLLKNPDIVKKNRSRSNSGRSRSVSSSDSKRSGSLKSNIPKCPYCKKQDIKFKVKDALEEHVSSSCLMYTECMKCKQNIQVKNLTVHQLTQCPQKEFYKQCKKCKEAIDVNYYDTHLKEGKCNPAKGKTVGRCPLCHKDIVKGDRGLIQHLVNDGCAKQKRK